MVSTQRKRVKVASVKHAGLNPVFKQKFIFDVTINLKIKIEVFDATSFKFHHSMGHISLSLKDLSVTQGQ